MAKKIYNCADALQFLKNKDNNSDIVFITISKYAKTQQGYDELKALLDVEPNGDIVSGYYEIEQVGDTNGVVIGTKVYVMVDELSPSVILKVDIPANTEFDLTYYWKWDVTGNENLGVDWGDGNVVDEMQHTYAENYVGEIKIYNKSIIFSHARQCDYVTEIHFEKPQILELTHLFFAYFPNLKKISGAVIVGECAPQPLPRNFFRSDKSLESLNGFCLVLKENEKLSTLETFAYDSNIDNLLLSQLSLVNFDKNAVTNYKHAFANTSIKTIPTKLVGKNGVDFENAFSNSKIVGIPSWLLANCENGMNAFLGCSDLTAVGNGISLSKLKNGHDMFSCTNLNYVQSKKIYDGLPQLEQQPAVPSNRNDTSDGHIMFNLNDGDEKKIAEIFEIPSINPVTGNPWVGGKNIPLVERGEFWISPKNWWITFANN